MLVNYMLSLFHVKWRDLRFVTYVFLLSVTCTSGTRHAPPLTAADLWFCYAPNAKFHHFYHSRCFKNISFYKYVQNRLNITANSTLNTLNDFPHHPRLRYWYALMISNFKPAGGRFTNLSILREGFAPIFSATLSYEKAFHHKKSGVTFPIGLGNRSVHNFSHSVNMAASLNITFWKC